jgi:rod shape-determining protein MreD
MIMRPGQQLLLPANPLFIWLTLLLALLINMSVNIGVTGRSAWAPDVLALVLVFWSVHQPLRIGVGLAFMFGLIMDVHAAGVLGQHALAYTVLGFFAITIHRRLLWFTVPTQALQMLPLFIMAHIIILVVRLVVGGGWPGWSLVFAPLLEALLWPVVSVLLLMPQRRAPDPDKTRPL